MGKYVNKPMADLAVDLAAGLSRLKQGYVDAAEALIHMIEEDQDYPCDFVLYQLTGYRSRKGKLTGEPMLGKTLLGDLPRLMLDICESAEIRTSEYEENVYDSAALAQRFRVSAKTLQRWRRRGLPARKLVFPDGKKRVAFLESSIQTFVESRRSQIARSVRFSQMTDVERDDLIAKARGLAAAGKTRLCEVVRTLSARTGRAVETVRYTIRKHDLEHPEEAVFPYLLVPLSEQEKMMVYRFFLRGVAVPVLAQRYHRTRGSIYRIVNEMRARQLLSRPISCMYNPQFELPNADDVILPVVASPQRRGRGATQPPGDLPPYLQALYEVPLLDGPSERDLFRKYNYLKYKADKLRKQIDINRVRTGQLKDVETLLVQANMTKNQIIRANLRLVVSIAKKHVGGPQTLFELISDGNVSLMRAVEKFDYSRGNRFSTYASWAIMRNFARSVPRERYQLDRFATGNDEVLEIAAGLNSYDPNEVNISELRESIDVVLAQLSSMERTILINHYGLDEGTQSRTLEQLGQDLGISKERVRQIEIKALKKLRAIMSPEQIDSLT